MIFPRVLFASVASILLSSPAVIAAPLSARVEVTNLYTSGSTQDIRMRDGRRKSNYVPPPVPEPPPAQVHWDHNSGFPEHYTHDYSGETADRRRERERRQQQRDNRNKRSGERCSGRQKPCKKDDKVTTVYCCTVM
ncbi:hypothetical protein CPB83DRAFT_849725, partial [Crepidotus variabilis]